MDNPFERLVRSVVDYAIYMLDPQGLITSWNAGAERIKGYREEEVLGKHLSLFYSADDQRNGIAQRNLEQARRTGRYVGDDWRVRRDGSRFWASVVIDAIHDDDGQLIGFAKITRDRTEEHRAQEARVQAERDYRLRASGAADHGLLLLDREGRITGRADPPGNRGESVSKSVSASGSDSVADSTNELVPPTAAMPAGDVGEPFSACFPFEDRQSGMPAQALLQANRQRRYQFETWRLRRDGKRFWANIIIDALSNANGEPTGFAVITRDATDKREAEQQLETSRAQLRQAQKLEAIGQLTGGIAHDFNNLLTGILGSLELLRRRAQAGRVDQLDRFIGAAESSAQRAAALTHRLLAFARRQSLALAPVNVNHLVGELGELVHRTLGKQIRFETQLDDACGTALTDRNQLETALLNLIINARDAMSDGGVVRIESRALRVAACDLPADATVSDGRYVRLSVIDNGSGMPPDVLEQAMDAFFTTKPAGQGTGLGLSMIQGFVRQTGGFVRLQSQVGIGTQVHLYLPAAAGEDGGADVPVAAAPIGQGEVVLVVEDEPAVRLLITEVLGELNYRFIEADHAQTALPILQSTSTKIDLLISDLALPGIGGRQLAEQGRRARPNLKVLFITGYERHGPETQEPLAAGMALLRKPFALSELGLRIRSLLSDRDQPPPSAR